MQVSRYGKDGIEHDEPKSWSAKEMFEELENQFVKEVHVFNMKNRKERRAAEARWRRSQKRNNEQEK